MNILIESLYVVLLLIVSALYIVAQRLNKKEVAFWREQFYKEKHRADVMANYCLHDILNRAIADQDFETAGIVTRMLKDIELTIKP